MWLSVDPLVEQTMDAYGYCYNNPINLIDPTGMSPDDVIILSYGKGEAGHRTGHQAILIGDDQNGWVYFSLDGDSFDYDGNNQYTIETFNTFDDFVNSEHNTFKNDYDDGKGFENSEKNADGEIKQRYKEGYRIETTAEQDKKMTEAAKKTTENGYNMFTNNCTHNCKDALDAGGLNNGENTLINSIPVPIFGGTLEVYERNFSPSAKQKEIEKSNRGKDIDSSLKPKKK